MSLSSVSLASQPSTLNTELHKPLIVGASVSADYFTNSPGKKLALRYTDLKNIEIKARRGTAGREILKSVSSTTLKDRSIIIGVDLFFWDSFSSTPEPSLSAIDHLLNQASERNIPVIFGEVPALMPVMQKSLSAINAKIEESCRRYSQCHVLPLDKILKKTLSDGYIIHENKKYELHDLLPDGLHIADVASDYLADQIRSLLENKR